MQLQFSLHATDEGTRQRIVPVKKWSLEEVADYGRRFMRPGDRKVTLNFAPGPGEALDAAVIARIFDPEHFLIKVTPINPTLSARRRKTAHVWKGAPGSIRAADAELRRRGFSVILSPSSPAEIESGSSCGQLWSDGLKAAAHAGLRAERRERLSYVTVDSMARRSEAWLRALVGKRRTPRNLAADRVALLVVDMQESFLDRRSPAYLPPARAALLNVRRLVEVFRRAGRPVLFTVRECKGSRQARVAAVLEPREADVFRKNGCSAFSDPGLERRLRSSGVAQLVLAGVKTDLCVKSTVRSAFALGWPSFVAADATAASSEARHVAALRAMARGSSVVMRVADVVAKFAKETRKS